MAFYANRRELRLNSHEVTTIGTKGTELLDMTFLGEGKRISNHEIELFVIHEK